MKLKVTATVLSVMLLVGCFPPVTDAGQESPADYVILNDVTEGSKVSIDVLIGEALTEERIRLIGTELRNDDRQSASQPVVYSLLPAGHGVRRRGVRVHALRDPEVGSSSESVDARIESADRGS